MNAYFVAAAGLALVNILFAMTAVVQSRRRSGAATTAATIIAMAVFLGASVPRPRFAAWHTRTI